MTATPGALRFLLLLTLVTLAAQLSTATLAQEAAFTITDGVLDGPDALPAGYHDLTVANPGEAPYNVTVLHLDDGATQEAVIPLYEAVDQANAGNGDPTAAIDAVLEFADAYGEVNAAPGGENRVGLVLDPGTYLLITGLQTEGESVPEYSYATLAVTGEPQADTPAPAQTVRMVDFAFALPPGVQAGEQVWEVVNAGEQIHHMVMFKLNEGATLEDVQAWMQGGSAGPPPRRTQATWA